LTFAAVAATPQRRQNAPTVCETAQRALP